MPKVKVVQKDFSGGVCGKTKQHGVQGLAYVQDSSNVYAGRKTHLKTIPGYEELPVNSLPTDKYLAFRYQGRVFHLIYDTLAKRKWSQGPGHVGHGYPFSGASARLSDNKDGFFPYQVNNTSILAVTAVSGSFPTGSSSTATRIGWLETVRGSSDPSSRVVLGFAPPTLYLDRAAAEVRRGSNTYWWFYFSSSASRSRVHRVVYSASTPTYTLSDGRVVAVTTVSVSSVPRTSFSMYFYDGGSGNTLPPSEKMGVEPYNMDLPGSNSNRVFPSLQHQTEESHGWDSTAPGTILSGASGVSDLLRGDEITAEQRASIYDALEKARVNSLQNSLAFDNYWVPESDDALIPFTNQMGVLGVGSTQESYRTFMQRYVKPLTLDIDTYLWTRFLLFDDKFELVCGSVTRPVLVDDDYPGVDSTFPTQGYINDEGRPQYLRDFASSRAGYGVDNEEYKASVGADRVILFSDSGTLPVISIEGLPEALVYGNYAWAVDMRCLYHFETVRSVACNSWMTPSEMDKHIISRWTSKTHFGPWSVSSGGAISQRTMKGSLDYLYTAAPANIDRKVRDLNELDTPFVATGTDEYSVLTQGALAGREDLPLVRNRQGRLTYLFNGLLMRSGTVTTFGPFLSGTKKLSIRGLMLKYGDGTGSNVIPLFSGKRVLTCIQGRVELRLELVGDGFSTERETIMDDLALRREDKKNPVVDIVGLGDPGFSARVWADLQAKFFNTGFFPDDDVTDTVQRALAKMTASRVTPLATFIRGNLADPTAEPSAFTGWSYASRLTAGSLEMDFEANADNFTVAMSGFQNNFQNVYVELSMVAHPSALTQGQGRVVVGEPLNPNPAIQVSSRYGLAFSSLRSVQLYRGLGYRQVFTTSAGGRLLWVAFNGTVELLVATTNNLIRVPVLSATQTGELSEFIPTSRSGYQGAFANQYLLSENGQEVYYVRRNFMYQDFRYKEVTDIIGEDFIPGRLARMSVDSTNGLIYLFVSGRLIVGEIDNKKDTIGWFPLELGLDSPGHAINGYLYYLSNGRLRRWSRDSSVPYNHATRPWVRFLDAKAVALLSPDIPVEADPVFQDVKVHGNFPHQINNLSAEDVAGSIIDPREGRVSPSQEGSGRLGLYLKGGETIVSLEEGVDF